MSGLKLFELGDLNITTGGSSANIGGMTSIGVSIITGENDDSLTLKAGTSIYFDTNETERMRITAGGSVGIGTNDPSEKLEVAGSAAGDGALIGNAKIGVWSDTNYAMFSHKDLISDVGSCYALLQKNDGSTHLNAASGTTLDFRIGGDVLPKMKIDGTTGYVGIGTSAPEKKFHIDCDGNFEVVYEGNRASSSAAATFLTSFGDKDVVLAPCVDPSTFTKMYIYWRTSDGTGYANYAFIDAGQPVTFTGQHISYSGNPNIKTDNNLDNYVGLIIKSLGIYRNDENDDITINNTWPVFQLTNSDNDKSVYGVITNHSDRSIANDNVDTGFNNGLDGKIRINSVGEGAIWICNKNGSLENGDYISSTTVTGYGGKQGELSLHNYTVAKITCDCDFSLTKVVKQKVKLIDDPTGKVISFDSQGNIEYEDILDPDGNIQMVYQYQTRFLQADGTLLVDQTDYETRLSNGESVYIACFVGCTYHCG